MKIIVCIKQVPDTAEVRLDPKTNTLAREGIASIMNPYDQHALEAAVQLKESSVASEVIALTMGPPQAENILREAISLGADRGVLVSDRSFAGADTWATSYTLERAIETLGGASLILCGKQAIDGDTAQVGPGLATRLGIPFVTCVQKIIQSSEEELTVERMMDDGYDILSLRLPALITVVKDVNTLRVPSLKGKMRAKKIKIEVLDAEKIGADESCVGLPGSPTQVVRVFAPSRRVGRTVLEGLLDEQLDTLASVVVDKL